MLLKSPFPGMDPYLEGAIFPDLHQSLANAIAEILAPKIAPKYVARLVPYTVKDKNPEAELGITYPDVAVLKHDRLEEPAVAYANAPLAMTEPDMVIPSGITVQLVTVEIRDIEKKRLVTAIEVLSPVNKREPGWATYQQKREKLHASGVHVLDIDLLRRGKRMILNYGVPDTHYLFSLWRADSENNAIWMSKVNQSLPVLPVPLKSPDPDVSLPLRHALDLICQRRLYCASIDYKKAPPPPAFTEAERQWMKQLLAKTL